MNEWLLLNNPYYRNSSPQAQLALSPRLSSASTSFEKYGLRLKLRNLRCLEHCKQATAKSTMRAAVDTITIASSSSRSL